MTPAPPQSRRNFAGLAGWFLLLGVAIALLTVLGDARLATPAVTEPAAWGDWVATTDPVVATVATLRLLLVGLTWYLLGASTIQVVARLTRSMAMVRIADAISVPLVRRVASATLGVGLAASMVSSASGTLPSQRTRVGTHAPAMSTSAVGESGSLPVAAAPRGAPGTARTPGTANTPTADHGGGVRALAADEGPRMSRTRPTTTRDGATMRLVGHPDDPLAGLETLGGPVKTTGPTLVELEGRDAPTMHRAKAGDGSGPDAGTQATRDGLPRQAVTGAAATATKWTVSSGDHLWGIAEAVVATHVGHAPSDSQVDPYWRRLIEHNRGRLPDPGNPDLILPGLELELPDPDPESA